MSDTMRREGSVTNCANMDTLGLVTRERREGGMAGGGGGESMYVVFSGMCQSHQ